MNKKMSVYVAEEEALIARCQFHQSSADMSKKLDRLSIVQSNLVIINSMRFFITYLG